MRRAGRTVTLAGLVAAGALAASAPRLKAQIGEYGELQYGRHLVAAGDCAACHTAERGEPFAGGRPIDTPFGTIYSSNITPDSETGIGAWTDEQFYRAMHNGVAPGGRRLYPAFPYPWFTKATRGDVDAIRAYLRTLPAVKYRRPRDTFPWPLSERAAMAGWNALYFKAGTYRPDPKKSPQWNRGAYLVEGLAHCGACHTPVNALGAPETSHAFEGGVLDEWFAPDLTGDKRRGLGDWSVKDVVQFLKTGAIDKTAAYGPMAQVVQDSTSAMGMADLTAMAVYLKSLPATRSSGGGDRPSAGMVSAGKAIYGDSCSACHGENGEGASALFPALKGDAIVQSDDPTTVVRLILDGGQAPSTKARPTAQSMPAYDWKLSDQQVAAVTSYIRGAWGNEAAAVSPGQVNGVREAVATATSRY